MPIHDNVISTRGSPCWLSYWKHATSATHFPFSDKKKDIKNMAIIIKTLTTAIHGATDTFVISNNP